MPELATAWVTLAVSADGMQRDIRRAFNQVDGDRAGRRVGDQFSRGAAANTNLTAVERKLAEAGQRGAEAMGKALKIGVASAAAVAAGTAATALKLGFDRLTAIDDARGKLSGLGHTAQSQAKIMDSALASVKGTAYGLGDAATIAASAVAAGVKPGQQLTDYLKMTADAASIAGTSLSDMGLIINQVRTGQAAYTDDLNQLAGRGLPIYQWIGDQMGVAASEVKELAAKGKVSSEVFEKAISANIGGAALKAGDTVKGAFANVKAALGRLGAAAEEPGFKRLPGAFAELTKRIDDATPRAKQLAEQFDAKVFDKWIPAAQGAFEQLKMNPAVRSNLGEVKSILVSLAGAAREAWPSLMQIGQSLGTASAALGVSSWRLFVTALEAAAGILNTLVGPVKTVADLMKNHQGIVTAAAGVWLLFRGIPAILGRVTGATVPLTQSLSRMGQQITGQTGALVPLRSRLTAIAGDYRNIGTAAQNNGQHLSSFNRLMTAVTNNSPTIRNMSNAFMGASTNVGAFTGALRAGVQPALNGLRTAASGVIGALGGPFSAALIAAGAAFAIISAQNQKAGQSLQAYQDAVRRTERSQVNLNSALGKSRGAFDDTVKGSAVERISAISDELEKAGERSASFMDHFRGADRSIWSRSTGDDTKYDKIIEKQASAARSTLQVINDLRMSNDDLTAAAYGPQAAFDALAAKMEAAGDSGKAAGGKFREARTEFLRQQDVARKIAPGVLEMATAMRTLADNTASAADKTSALISAMDALNPAATAADAEAAHTRAVAAVTQSDNPVDSTKGIGNELFKADGAINTSLPNGTNAADLLDALKSIRNETARVGQNSDITAFTAALQQNDSAFAELARRYQTDIPHIKAAYDTLGGTLADASGKLGDISRKFNSGEIPTDHPINVDVPGGKEVLDLLTSLGEKVHADNNKEIVVDDKNGLGAQTLQLLKNIGYEAKVVDNKLVLVKADTTLADEAMSAFSNEWKTMTTTVDFRTPARMPAFPGDTTVPKGGRADGAIVPHVFGAIVPMADGGLQWIEKPKTAGIYAGRGAGTIFAEEETGGEAYIPLAKSKRGRSMAILMEVARLFGINSNAEGSITVDELKSYASGISGGTYVRGGPAGLTGTDCSGGQAAIANFITGAGGRFSTGNESQALLARGFQQGDPPSGIAAYWIGWKNGGPGGGHTAGTIMDPEGGNVNVEMGGKSGGGAFGGGAAGASEFPNRAWIALAGYGEDPTKSGGGTSAAVKSASASVTSAKASTASAQNALDKANADLDVLKAKGASADKLTAAEKKRDVAEQKLTAAQERQSAAETRLSEVKDKEATKAEKGGDSGGQDLGKSFASGALGGIMETLGLPGFSNFMEWPLMKSSQAALNAFAGPIKGALEGKLGIQQPGWSPGMPIGEEGNVVGLPGEGGELPGISLPGVGDFLKPMPDAGRQLRPNEAHQGSGGAPGPSTTVNYNMSNVDPKQGLLKADAHANQTYKKTLGGVRPQ
ncbi:tape measure protein [Mycobacterium sp. DL99]|uniref:tape measure protein n=1 Tax=Mycobacterium sp. DL99 TaxID=2528957 RepID=UPI001080CA8D|nr:tape measure protein [Mycobacterium sp. DL99]